MRFRLLIPLLLLLTQVAYSQGDAIDADEAKKIKTLIMLFKQKDIDKIANLVSYPLHRAYPIPSIKSKAEFKRRFNEVFDQAIIDKIAESKIDNWVDMDWRGFMLNAGDVWLDSEDFTIIAINDQSDFEKRQEKDLIRKDKAAIHSSLKTFERPIYKIKTKHYLIRVDELTKGFRYACWKIGQKESSKPDLIITDGDWASDGSSGDSVYTFTNGDYTYEVRKDYDSDTITLTVSKEKKLVIEEEGMLIN